jgi:DNA-binding NtrC family response regulator
MKGDSRGSRTDRSGERGGNGASEAGERTETVALVIDDVAHVAEEVRRAMDRAGCTVVLTRAIDEVFAASRQPAPDLVLVNVAFEDGVGLHLAAVLRRLHRPARVVAYSRGLRTPLAEQAEALGVADHLIDVQELPEWIERVLPHLVAAARADRRAAEIGGLLQRRSRGRLSADLAAMVSIDAARVDFESGMIRATLAVQPSLRAAARGLGLCESTLRARMRKLGLRGAAS